VRSPFTYSSLLNFLAVDSIVDLQNGINAWSDLTGLIGRFAFEKLNFLSGRIAILQFCSRRFFLL